MWGLQKINDSYNFGQGWKREETGNKLYYTLEFGKQSKFMIEMGEPGN